VSVELRALGEVCKTTSGGTPSRSKPHYFEGTIPWVKSGELPDGIVVRNSEYISEEAISNSSAKLLPAGTLLVALYGATVGKLGILSRPAATNQAVCAIFPSDAIDTKFLFWYLLAKRPWLIGQAAGGAQPNISQGVVRSLLVPVMPLQAQHAIVAEIEKQFSRLDEAVANLQRVKANLKRYKASVLKDAVEGRLVPTEAELASRDGRSFETGEQLLQRILETRRSHWQGRGKYKEPLPPDSAGFAKLPMGWLWASGDQLTSVITDGEHITPRRTAEGVLLLSARNVLNGSLALEDVDYVPEDEYERIARRIEIHAGDVLLSCSGTVGRSCVVPVGLRFTLVRSVAVMRPVIMLADFMTYNLQSPLGQSQIDDRKTQTAQANLFQGKIRQLVFALPPLTEQVRIVAEVDRRLTLIRGVEAEVDANLKRAQSLRQSALRKYLFNL